MMKRVQKRRVYLKIIMGNGKRTQGLFSVRDLGFNKNTLGQQNMHNERVRNCLSRALPEALRGSFSGKALFDAKSKNQ